MPFAIGKAITVYLFYVTRENAKISSHVDEELFALWENGGKLDRVDGGQE